MTRLSSGHKYTSVDDESLDRLLVLDGDIMEVGGGYWVKIIATAVPKTKGKPRGVNYALCLFNPADKRVLCYDNAHPVAMGSGPAKKLSIAFDHRHQGDRVRPYAYNSADALITDFWTDVEAILKKEGVS